VMKTDVLRRTFKGILSKLRELFSRPAQMKSGRVQNVVGIGMRHVTLITEGHPLTTDELLKRMPKEQAITLVQGILRRMEESLNVPDIPAAKARMEKVLEELKLSQPRTTLG
jgi:hypothetical protein